ncbi:MAG: hypothetical protein JOZ15_22250 [Acidobacteria bacterium]|nr:hypothetical protein [Acidobacteriota bacterium]
MKIQAPPKLDVPADSRPYTRLHVPMRQLHVPMRQHSAGAAAASGAETAESAGGHPAHGLRRWLPARFALPFAALGLAFSPIAGPAVAEPPACSTVQTWGSNVERAAATQRLDAAVRQQSISLDGPEGQGQPLPAAEPLIVERSLPAEHLPQLERDHRSAAADPGAAASRDNLHEALGAALDAHETLADHEEAVKFVIDYFALLEKQRTGKHSPESVETVRRWQAL